MQKAVMLQRDRRWQFTQFFSLGQPEGNQSARLRIHERD